MKSSFPSPGTRKHLGRWLGRLLSVVLLSCLNIPAAHIQGAEASDQTYKFVLNDVVYTCSGLNEYGEIWVHAAPVSADTKFISVQLYFPDLQKYIPEVENIKQRGTTVLSGDIWKECENLKSIEFVTVYDSKHSYTSAESSTSVSILGNCTNLAYIYVTGNWTHWKFTDIPLAKHWLYYTDGITLSGNYGSIWTSPISDVLCKLVYETTLKQYPYFMDLFGLTPVVELQAIRKDVPLTSEWYPMEFDETGSPKVNLIGDLNYRVSAKELHGLKNPWKEMGAHQFGEPLFKACFDNYFGGTERILYPKSQTLTENGLELVRITNDNDNEKYPDADGKYHLRFDGYNIELNSGGIPMCYKFNAESKSTAEIKVSSYGWTPNSLKVRISSITGDKFGDDAVLCLCETKNGEVVQFVPFKNNIAQLYSLDNQFYINTHTYPKTKYNPERHMWYWDPGFNASICIKIGDNYYNLQNCKIDEDIASRESYIYYSADQIILSFSNLFNVLPAGWKTDAGALSDGTSYPTGNPDSGSAYLIKLRPETTYPVQVYYNMNGKEYTSNVMNLKTWAITAKAHSVTTDIQSATIIYSADNISSRNGHMEYRDVKAVTNQSQTFNPTSSRHARFTFSELPPGADLTILCQPYYVSEAGWEMKIGKPLETKASLTTPQWHSGTSEALTTKRARLKYATNINNVNDTYVEWRRVDAPAVIQSNKAMCPVVEGNLVGILNNLNPDVYYQFRPVYEYGAKKYYGEWVGIFTGDANVWFDPEITTSPALVSEEGKITLRGAVLPGSGDVTEQGFEIWPEKDAADASTYTTDIDETSHRFITCDGISMAVELSDLLSGTTYAYRTYAKVDNKSFTGSEMTFTTPGTQGVGEITIDDSELEIVGYYNLQGVRSDRPMPGLNIVVYSNGKTEKRIFR